MCISVLPVSVYLYLCVSVSLRQVEVYIRPLHLAGIGSGGSAGCNVRVLAQWPSSVPGRTGANPSL